MNINKTVFVVDDDLAVRTALTRSLSKRGYHVEAYDSGEAFLLAFQHNQPSVLVLDVRMPGISGLELQDILSSQQSTLPIIFITGHGDIPMSVRAIKEGAVEFLEKPYRVEVLLRQIEQAITLDEQTLLQQAKRQEILDCFSLLTSRERDVMIRLVAGAANSSNKIIAGELSISHRTVDDHRARIMSKMQARSLPELVDMAKICDIYKA